jgi:xanthine dehydrogenase molybdopterin binding subunit/xanthine dehydrogenase small subunit
MADAFEITLNGRLIRIEDESPNTPLLDYLRKHGLTGSKEGCAEGDCGACSVAIIDRDSQGDPTYRAINSCLVPICLMAGREIVTVEGIKGKTSNSKLQTPNCGSNPECALHPVQQKMVERHGSQCGYCTPGFIVSMFEGYYRDDIRTQDQLDDQLCGNLCRCTGYRPIRDAAIEAFAERHRQNGKDVFAERLKAASPELGEAEFDLEGEKFFRPTSLSALLHLMREHPEARLIAGATELGLEISKRFKKFATIISVEAVPELKEINATKMEWHIGAAVTLTEIEDKLAEEYPALGKMLRVFGSRQIRNRATMGGNLVTASPIGDSAPVLLALDAKVVLASTEFAANGEGRWMIEDTVAIERFFMAYRKTALQPGQVLKKIIIPRSRFQRGITRKVEWYKVSKRREMDISTVAGCFALELDAAGIVQKARLAYGGVAAMPARAVKTEEILTGKPWNREMLAQAVEVLSTEFTPISDVRGAAEYRRGLITSLLQKFFEESFVGDDVRRLRSPSSKYEQSLLTSSPTKKAASPHESGHKHVSGDAMYVDDVAANRPMLDVWPVCSPHARARILKRDVSAARQMPGVHAVLLAEDIPGHNDAGTKHDEPLLPANEVSYHGQPIAVVIGDSPAACRAAAEKVVIKYEPLKPILTLAEALATKSFHNERNFIRRGDIEAALKKSPLTFKGTFELGGQEHFYLETQAAWAEPGEDGSVFVASSTQHPSEVQMVIAHVLDVPFHKVVVQSPRMGGGFGGKETQAAMPAAIAALGAKHTGRPVRVRFNRDQDMAITGHRHPFRAEFEIGFDTKGVLQAARVHLYSDGGWALDLSQAVTDRALFHLDNAYYIPAVEFRGQVARTNLSSNTAFRGFGGPQGMLVIEEIIDRIARRLGLPPELVRERNLYRGKGETNTTHYGQQIEDNRIQTIWKELKKSSALEKRRKLIAKWNAEHEHSKRGIAITPVKFGISFTVTHLNQAGALVLMYQDGTVQVNHGATEMGQGVHTNMAAIAAQELGARPEQIRVMPTSTDKVPNTSATAASCGTDLNGAAVKNACETLRTRLIPIAVRLLKEKTGKTSKPVDVQFADGIVRDRRSPKKSVGLDQVLRTAYLERISLSATGYYCTPGIHWDRVAGRGKPFHYFAYGAAVAEVEIDGLTGMHRVLRADILHDVGDSINEGINRGQVEGGFIQGMGWLTTEELKWDDKGRLLTHSPDTYKIPAVGDTPHIFNVSLLKNAAQKSVVYGTKAVGEPPLMLAISVREAIRDAVAGFSDSARQVDLASPATCEVIFMAIQQQRKKRKQAGALSVPEMEAKVLIVEKAEPVKKAERVQ